MSTKSTKSMPRRNSQFAKENPNMAAAVGTGGINPTEATTKQATEKERKADGDRYI